MRIELLPIYYSCDDYFKRLSINCWYVGVYPLTFTIQECAEEYCEMVGWKFIRIDTETSIGAFSMRVEIPVGENLFRTIHNNYYDTTDLESIL